MQTIVIIVPELLPVPPTHGGAVEHWVDEVSHRLHNAQRKVTVISRPANIETNANITYIGIPWTSADNFFYQLKNKLRRWNPLRYLGKIQNVISYGIRAAKYTSSFDIIYLHNEPNMLLFFKKMQRQKLVLHMHNDHLSAPIFRFFYRYVLAKTDAVIFVSAYIYQRALNCFPEYAEKFHIVLNSTDPETFKPYDGSVLNQLSSELNLSHDKRYLLFVGRLIPAKGVHVLLQAFRLLVNDYPDIRLIIAGSSFYADAVKSPYVEELIALSQPIKQAILFTGFLPHKKLKHLYSIADIVVMPSVWQEPSGLVALEAMASGTCLIASEVGGIPEALENGKHGLLVKPNNPQELETAIRKVLSSPELKLQMQTAARSKIVSEFTWERLTDDLEQIFLSLS